jgi:hypothetical protein
MALVGGMWKDIELCGWIQYRRQARLRGALATLFLAKIVLLYANTVYDVERQMQALPKCFSETN